MTTKATTAINDAGPRTALDRRTWILLAFGAVIVAVTLGTRHSFGLFLDPVTRDVDGVGREAFGFAIALQNLFWGLGQPIAGAIADRYGSARVIFIGGAMYAAGLALSAVVPGSLSLQLGLGVLVGFGLSCTTYAVVLGAVGRWVPPDRRSTAMGVVSVGGSIGIFVSVPITLGLISSIGWIGALLSLAAVVALASLTAPQLAGRNDASAGQQSLGEALSEAMRHRGFLLLVLGFFVCGFQLAFIATHLPAFLVDQRLDLWVGGLALAIIGATNIAGTLGCGVLGDRYSKKNTLTIMYLIRGGVVIWYMLTPISPTSTMIFAAIIGAAWLGVVPLTSGIVAQVFGPRYLATLVGIVFFLHQVGSFLGAWLGGYVFERTGSYDAVWWMVALLGLFAALVHWLIDERPISVASRPRIVSQRV